MRANRTVTSVFLVSLALTMMVGLASAENLEPVPAFGSWTLFEGAWDVWDNTLLHMESRGGNTNAYVALEQKGDTHVYEWTVQFLDTTGGVGPLAGLHILSNDATHGGQRGDSYLIWQEGPNMKVYKSRNGVELATLITVPVTASVGETHHYRVIADTLENLLSIYRNGELVITIEDAEMYVEGSYISARTNVTAAIFSDIKYGGR